MLPFKNSTSSPTFYSVELKNNVATDSQEYIADTIAVSQLQRSKGKVKEITWNAFFLIFPVLLLTCLLFAFIFGYRVDQKGEPFEQLRGIGSSSLDNDAYYVNLNSTLLIFLVSWMSSLAPMLAGFAVALAAYPVAARLFEDTTQQNQVRLLTPYQLHLTLRLINGSTWGAMWKLMVYRLSWGKRVKGQGAALVSLFRVTLVVIILSALVFATDTWLHIVTKTVSVAKLSVAPDHDASYGLSLLSPNCTMTNNSIASQAGAGLVCTMDTGTNLLQAGTTTLQTLNNQSNALSVLSNGPDPTLAYLTVNPSDRDQQHDFSAATYGMRTSCRPITRSCNMNTEGGLATWNCSNGVFAQAASNKASLTIQQMFFDDETMTQPSDGGASVNPSYFVFASLTQLSANPSTNLVSDPEVVSGSGALAAILLCSVGFYDTTYDVVEGNVTHMSSILSNVSVANVFIPALSESGFGYPNMANAFNMAASVAATAQDLSDQFALAYSKIALCIGAGSVVRTPALAAQTRATILVARVPKAPLFLLMVINLIFVVLGIALAVDAARSSPEAHEVQSRFSIAGLVAGMFEKETMKTGPSDRLVLGKVERLFREYYEGGATKRVGIARGQDGELEFKALEKELYGDGGVGSAYGGWNGRFMLGHHKPS